MMAVLASGGGSECSGSRTFEWVLDNFEKSAKMMRVDWVDGFVKG